MEATDVTALLETVSSRSPLSWASIGGQQKFGAARRRAGKPRPLLAGKLTCECSISGARWDRTGDVSLRLTRSHFTRGVSLQLSREEVRIGSAPSNTLTGKSKLPGKSQASGARGNQLPWRSAGGGGSVLFSVANGL